jgi:heme-degrading monooxygenase HmoA
MSDTAFARLPAPPYYAVIFSSRRHATDDGYAATAKRMVELAQLQLGFLGAESARDADGFGITVSYWTTEQAITQWKAQAEHVIAQERGQRDWYSHYELRVAKVERAYGRPGGRGD